MEKCIEELKRIESIVSNFQDLMGRDSDSIKRELRIGTPESMRSALDDIQEENRLLRIGIVGRVKAGKSSLLNALLFKGQSILPKAATPMTASLTTLQFGEKLSATLDFFTENDIRDIHRKADQYESELKYLKKEILKDLKDRNSRSGISHSELIVKAEKRAESEMKKKPILYACYDQSNQMKTSGINRDDLVQNTTLTATNYEKLKTQLVDYVSANGKYMPFTKSINIFLPLKTLQDVLIVDTPGINDPVASREERTRDYLKHCDVILVISPAGQFMDSEDTELMDRIGSKEGVNKLYVVASQVDHLLFGSKKTENNGHFHEVLQSIKTELGDHLKSVISNLKDNHPEIPNIFNQLIDEHGSRIICSSGICESIINCSGKIKKMDEDSSHAWSELIEEYPDFFSKNDFTLSEANLKKLSNIDSIHTIISDVRNEKNDIIRQKSEDFLKSRQDLVLDLKHKLLESAEERVKKVQETDINELENKIARIQQNMSKGSMAIDNTYADCIDELENTILTIAKKEISNAYREVENATGESEKTITETSKYLKGGLFNEIANSLWGGGWEERTEHYTTVRAGAVLSKIVNFIETTENDIKDKIQSELYSWRKTLQKSILQAIRNMIKDEDIDGQLITKATHKVIDELPLNGIEFQEKLPSSLNVRGTLKRDDADEFINNAETYLSKTKRRMNSFIRNYISNFTSKLREKVIHDELFKNYRSELENLNKQIKNRELTLSELARFQEELKVVS